MEAIIKKYQQKFRKAKDEMSKWDELQSRLISQFRNATSIIARLEIIQNPKNYASLNSVGGIEVAVLRKQMDTLQTILLSMKNTMDDFRSIVLSLEKLQHDGKQLAKGSSNKMNRKQLQHRIGIKPSLTNCIDGLVLLHEMFLADSSDLGALQQLLVDQPNILNEEGQSKHFHNSISIVYTLQRQSKQQRILDSSTRIRSKYIFLQRICY
ncbi:uncharacterized protein At5g43822-like isoform X4 [Durio zibethinus]|uniref:Uncharacterized protein At5g43822-like isoform X4 n=1 Tax=Durio zibethinus TaxID=66656 RepID=A0A6P5Y621_DURZI|nr:uncharacterized protein At5g43822-like isoform X4 [Durio zibethinus]